MRVHGKRSSLQNLWISRKISLLSRAFVERYFRTVKRMPTFYQRGTVRRRWPIRHWCAAIAPKAVARGKVSLNRLRPFGVACPDRTTYSPIGAKRRPLLDARLAAPGVQHKTVRPIGLPYPSAASYAAAYVSRSFCGLHRWRQPLLRCDSLRQVSNKSVRDACRWCVGLSQGSVRYRG